MIERIKSVFERAVGRSLVYTENSVNVVEDAGIQVTLSGCEEIDGVVSNQISRIVE